MQIYDMLTDVAMDVNVVYGFQILTGVTIQFIKIVFSSFYVYYYKIVSTVERPYNEYTKCFQKIHCREIY